jgi:hypothetical protein
VANVASRIDFFSQTASTLKSRSFLVLWILPFDDTEHDERRAITFFFSSSCHDFS